MTENTDLQNLNYKREMLTQNLVEELRIIYKLEDLLTDPTFKIKRWLIYADLYKNLNDLCDDTFKKHLEMFGYSYDNETTEEVNNSQVDYIIERPNLYDQLRMQVKKLESHISIDTRIDKLDTDNLISKRISLYAKLQTALHKLDYNKFDRYSENLKFNTQERFRLYKNFYEDSDKLDQDDLESRRQNLLRDYNYDLKRLRNVKQVL